MVDRDTEQHPEKETLYITSQGSNFLRGNFDNRDNVRAQI